MFRQTRTKDYGEACGARTDWGYLESISSSGGAQMVEEQEVPHQG